ncbi:hypothetical protein POM88_012039 [Heracleum sosnowskyi]|uniref:Uncharacterized protein n=1 Tax=Heracleum sosnowskyi TaxID=360622 RepID=A0AAD8IXX8_9APIA|nr:hypothetical protein POM88_012039 [Heracleum sosnowskyi]
MSDSTCGELELCSKSETVVESVGLGEDSDGEGEFKKDDGGIKGWIGIGAVSPDHEGVLAAAGRRLRAWWPPPQIAQPVVELAVKIGKSLGYGNIINPSYNDSQKLWFIY